MVRAHGQVTQKKHNRDAFGTNPRCVSSFGKKVKRKMDESHYGYGFRLNGLDYVFDNIEAAETAALMAHGMGSSKRYCAIPIYPYFGGQRANRCGARVIMEPDGSAQCAY